MKLEIMCEFLWHFLGPSTYQVKGNVMEDSSRNLHQYQSALPEAFTLSIMGSLGLSYGKTGGYSLFFREAQTPFFHTYEGDEGLLKDGLSLG